MQQALASILNVAFVLLFCQSAMAGVTVKRGVGGGAGGAGGPVSFADVTSGTSVAPDAYVIGNGSSITPSGTGTVTANLIEPISDVVDFGSDGGATMGFDINLSGGDDPAIDFSDGLISMTATTGVYVNNKSVFKTNDNKIILGDAAVNTVEIATDLASGDYSLFLGDTVGGTATSRMRWGGNVISIGNATGTSRTYTVDTAFTGTEAVVRLGYDGGTKSTASVLSDIIYLGNGGVTATVEAGNVINIAPGDIEINGDPVATLSDLAGATTCSGTDDQVVTFDAAGTPTCEVVVPTEKSIGVGQRNYDRVVDLTNADILKPDGTLTSYANCLKAMQAAVNPFINSDLADGDTWSVLIFGSCSVTHTDMTEIQFYDGTAVRNGGVKVGLLIAPAYEISPTTAYPVIDNVEIQPSSHGTLSIDWDATITVSDAGTTMPLELFRYGGGYFQGHTGCGGVQTQGIHEAGRREILLSNDLHTGVNWGAAAARSARNGYTSPTTTVGIVHDCHTRWDRAGLTNYIRGSGGEDADDIGMALSSVWGSELFSDRIVGTGVGILASGTIAGTFDSLYIANNGIQVQLGDPYYGGGIVKRFVDDNNDGNADTGSCAATGAACAPSFGIGVDGVKFTNSVIEGGGSGTSGLVVAFEPSSRNIFSGVAFEDAPTMTGHSVLVGAGVCSSATTGSLAGLPCGQNAECTTSTACQLPTQSGTCNEPATNTGTECFIDADCPSGACDLTDGPASLVALKDLTFDGGGSFPEGESPHNALYLGEGAAPMSQPDESKINFGAGVSATASGSILGYDAAADIEVLVGSDFVRTSGVQMNDAYPYLVTNSRTIRSAACRAETGLRNGDQCYDTVSRQMFLCMTVDGNCNSADEYVTGFGRKALVLEEEFISLQGELTASSTTGNVGQLGWQFSSANSARLGSMAFDAGAYAGIARLYTHTVSDAASGSIYLAPVFVDGEETFEFGARLLKSDPTTGGADERFDFLAGLCIVSGAAPTDGTCDDGIYLLHDRESVDGLPETDNWIACTALNATLSCADTGVELTESAMDYWRVATNANASSVTFYSADSATPVATIATDIPTGVSNYMYPVFMIRKEEGTVSKQVYISHFRYIDQSPPR